MVKILITLKRKLKHETLTCEFSLLV